MITQLAISTNVGLINVPNRPANSTNLGQINDQPWNQPHQKMLGWLTMYSDLLFCHQSMLPALCSRGKRVIVLNVSLCYMCHHCKHVCFVYNVYTRWWVWRWCALLKMWLNHPPLTPPPTLLHANSCFSFYFVLNCSIKYQTLIKLFSSVRSPSKRSVMGAFRISPSLFSELPVKRK